MVIGDEVAVIRLLGNNEDLTAQAGRAILGEIGVQVNGRTVGGGFDVDEVRDALLDGIAHLLALNYVALAGYGIIYVPEIYDEGEIKAAMIAKFGPGVGP